MLFVVCSTVSLQSEASPKEVVQGSSENKIESESRFNFLSLLLIE